MSEEIGMLVRERRKQMGLTQEELGNMLSPQVSFAAISSWERVGNIPDGRISELAEVLGIAEADLTGGVRYVSGTDGRLAFCDAVGRADLSLLATNVLLRLATVEGLCADRGRSLEFVGSHESIVRGARYITADDVASVWDEVLASGFVERKSDAEWHLALVLPQDA